MLRQKNLTWVKPLIGRCYANRPYPTLTPYYLLNLGLETRPGFGEFESKWEHLWRYSPKFFCIVENFLRGGLEPTPVKYPWYGNPPPYPLSHSGLALRIIFAIIFSIFETFLEIIETRTGFDEFESKWKHFGKHLS